MRNPYEVLGLEPGTDAAVLEARYNELKAKLSEDRFLPGDEGNAAARQLTELESAWGLIHADINKKNAQDTYGSDLGQIDDLIKKGEYDEAQRLMDSVGQRTAEWYYLQSIIYYKREWMTDCRKQLNIAISLEPNNAKYKSALEKLDMVMGNANADPHNIGVDPKTGQAYGPYGNDVPPQRQGQMCGGNGMSNCCMAYLCTDCCCTLTRCCG